MITSSRGRFFRFFRFSSFVEKQKAERRQERKIIEATKPDISAQDLHPELPSFFKRGIYAVAIPSLFAIQNVYYPFFTTEFHSAVCSIFQNNMLLCCTLAGSSFAYNWMHKGGLNFSKLTTILALSIPLPIFGIADAILQNDVDIITFLLAYLGVTAVAYSGYKVLFIQNVPKLYFLLIRRFGLFALLGISVALYLTIGQLNQEKSVEMKLNELQSLSDISREDKS